MNRTVPLVAGGAVLLVAGLVGGALLFSTTIPPYDPLPTTTPLPTPEADVWEPRPQPTGMLPTQRLGDVLQPDDVLITRAQLVEYAEGNAWRVTPETADEWVSLGELTLSCMAEKGYWYDPRVPPTVVTDATLPEGFREALGGSTGAGDAYDWRDAGCAGRAIHELGITS